MDKILDGKKLAAERSAILKEEIDRVVPLVGITPTLAIIFVGDNPSSEIYIRNKLRTSDLVGIKSMVVKLDGEISKQELIKEINKLNNDNSIHGIIIQQPLPPPLQSSISEFVELVSPGKDVEGLHPTNRGKLFDYNEEIVACTAKGIINLLEYYDIKIAGKEVIIINRSNLVGKPLFFLFLKRNATVTICHTSTVNIEEHMRRADILVVAVGRPNFITKDKIFKVYTEEELLDMIDTETIQNYLRNKKLKKIKNNKKI